VWQLRLWGWFVIGVPQQKDIYKIDPNSHLNTISQTSLDTHNVQRCNLDNMLLMGACTHSKCSHLEFWKVERGTWIDSNIHWITIPKPLVTPITCKSALWTMYSTQNIPFLDPGRWRGTWIDSNLHWMPIPKPLWPLIMYKTTIWTMCSSWIHACIPTQNIHFLDPRRWRGTWIDSTLHLNTNSHTPLDNMLLVGTCACSKYSLLKNGPADFFQRGLKTHSLDTPTTYPKFSPIRQYDPEFRNSPGCRIVL